MAEDAITGIIRLVVEAGTLTCEAVFLKCLGAAQFENISRHSIVCTSRRNLFLHGLQALFFVGTSTHRWEVILQFDDGRLQ